MKLRNKRTGEIGYTAVLQSKAIVVMDENAIQLGSYTSLAELNEEWTDYEEQKGNWTIDPMNENYIDDGRYTAPDELERYEELGLKFNTKEEAEKAVEKLKAWKRLKDKGFRFDLSPALGHCDDKKFDISIIGTMPAKWWYNDKVVDDIHYIFGGGE